MAATVETQRLISVSLGKIAQSRVQRGGINLHKNLLVASVLNKARTAFMMENYNNQISLQQRQQQQQIVYNTTAQPAAACNTVTQAAAEPQRDGNSLSAHVVKTCQTQTTPDVESGSSLIDTQPTPELDSGASAMQDNTAPSANDKENISPSKSPMEEDSSSSNNDCKQDCVSGDQHVEAANQLSYDAQLAGSPASFSSSFSSCKQSSSSSPSSTTCSSVLKRRRDNPEALVTSEPECPANKKARVSSSDCSNSQSCGALVSGCEYESADGGESDMQTPDSPQITNLVSIFNSGFSGLCVSGSSSYESNYQSDNSSLTHQWSNSRKLSDNQSLHCSSQVERIGSLSSAIVLSA